MPITASEVKALRDRTGAGMMECKKALTETNGDLDEAIALLRKKGAASAEKKSGRIAAEGVVELGVNPDRSLAVLVELNCETDFVAKDDSFKSFAREIAGAVMNSRPASVEDAADLELNGVQSIEAARQELIAKIGENISVRRVGVVSAADGVVGGYVHGNNRIAVLVELAGGDDELAKDVAMHVAAVNPAVVSPADMPEELLQKEREIYAAQAADSGKPPEIVEKMIEGRVRKYLSENSLTEQAFVKDPDTTVGKLVKAAGATIAGFTRFEVGEGIEVEKVDFAAEVAAQLGN